MQRPAGILQQQKPTQSVGSGFGCKENDPACTKDACVPYAYDGYAYSMLTNAPKKFMVTTFCVRRTITRTIEICNSLYYIYTTQVLHIVRDLSFTLN